MVKGKLNKPIETSEKDRTDYRTVTELSGEKVSQEQVERIYQRYYWADIYCRNKSVLEVACGSGQGIGYLGDSADSFTGGDISEDILTLANATYKGKARLCCFDAQALPFQSHSQDIVLLFEAIYYLPNVKQFLKECRRVLCDRGELLIVTANKDLYDFNPSPYSHTYYGVVEMSRLLRKFSFQVTAYGSWSVKKLRLRQKFLRLVKKLAVSLNLIPKTMAGKQILKRLVFGRLLAMPTRIEAKSYDYHPPVLLPLHLPCEDQKVLFFRAVKTEASSS